MLTPTLQFTHKEGDYEVIVRTQDIVYSWQRFKGRIDYTRMMNTSVSAPREYCEYTSQDECVLHLDKPFSDELTTQEEEALAKVGKKWSN